MNRQQKSEVVELFKNSFSKNQTSFLVGVQGLTVAQLQNLRKELKKSGGTLKVTKARLMKRALAELNSGSQELLPYFKGQIGIVFVGKESPGVAKTLYQYAKTHQALKLVAGSLEEKFLDHTAISRLAELPSKEILLAQLCGTLQAPATRLVTVLNATTVKLLCVLGAIGEQKQQQVS